MPTTPHLLRFPATAAGLAEGARALSALLDNGGRTGLGRYNVELAFEEIAANIVNHGATNGEITAAVVLEEAETILIFEDDGVPFDPRDWPEPTLPSSIEEATVGGLGIMLVRKISTRMIYERTTDGRNRLTIAIPVQ